MWRETIMNLTDDYEFYPPATSAQIESAEESLSVSLPEELRALLTETNGVRGKYGYWLIWPIESIQKENLEYRSYPDFRELYMPFDPLLFFAEHGNGDLYAYIITSVGITRPDIFIWEHESDSRRSYAFGLTRFLEKQIKESE